MNPNFGVLSLSRTLEGSYSEVVYHLKTFFFFFLNVRSLFSGNSGSEKSEIKVLASLVSSETPPTWLVDGLLPPVFSRDLPSVRGRLASHLKILFFFLKNLFQLNFLYLDNCKFTYSCKK